MIAQPSMIKRPVLDVGASCRGLQAGAVREVVRRAPLIAPRSGSPLQQLVFDRIVRAGGEAAFHERRDDVQRARPITSHTAVRANAPASIGALRLEWRSKTSTRAIRTMRRRSR